MVFSRFCRICACELNKACEIENNPEKPELPLLLKRYFPEFDIKVENACLCIGCASILYTFHNFKRKCLRMEQDIRLHIRKHPEVKAVNLNDILAPKELTNNTLNGIIPSLETTATTEEPIKKETEVCLETTAITEGPIRKETGLSLETIAITEEPIRKETELCLETEGTIEEETTEPPPGTAKHICKFCSTVFPQEQSLLCHRKNCSKLIRYECYKCSRNFASKKLYDTHVAYHKKDSLRRHNIYTYSSNDQKQLKNHVNPRICKNFKCEVCAEKFAQKATLTEHMLTHTKKELYICSICKYTTSVITELDRHAREVHKIGTDTRLMCTLSSCRRVFFTEISLELHERHCRNNERRHKRYQCDKCSREFALKKPYYEHLAYHKKSNSGRHTCKICNFVYHTQSSLWKHNIVKHMSDDKKRFQCDVCAMRFLDKTVLTIHMRTHTGERPYKCPLCTYDATIKSSIYKHVSARHTNTKVQFDGAECVLVQ